MWGCNYYSEIPWLRYFFSHGIFSLLIWGLLIFILVFLLTRIFKSNGNTPEKTFRDRDDSLEILKIRYAKGEIAQDDFNKMKQILSQP